MHASFKRFARLGLALSGVGLLAGCNQERPEAQDPNAAVLNQFVAHGQVLSAPVVETKSPSPNFAVLTLPAGAAPVAKLTEKQYANGWRQNLWLGDSNDLSIEIASDVATAASTTYKPNLIRLYKPTAEGIRQEILSRFKGVPMRIVGRPMSNALGQYGLAIGAGPHGMRCAFAWQWVDNLAATARGERGTFFESGEMPASIRMRMCRSGVTADQIAEWFSGLQITDVANVARISSAIKSNSDVLVANNGAPAVVGSSDSLDATLIGAPRSSTSTSAARRRHVAKRRSAPPAESDEAPSFAPPGAPLTTPSSPSADGRQFLAPPASAAGYAPGTGSAPIYNTPQPDPSLPSQAYRGPSGGRAVVAPPSGGAPLYLGPKPI